MRVRATSVTSGTVIARIGKHPDSRLFTFLLRLMFGLRRPKKAILGYELSGEVAAVGPSVTRFEEGDQVYGTTTGLRAGAYAEYVCLPQQWNRGVVAKKPEQITHSQAAAVPVGGMTALHILNRAKVTVGQRVLVYGASGSVGTYAVQLAKARGASVTGVCGTAHVDMVRSIGADEVVDYTTEGLTAADGRYDVVFDAVGKIPRSQLKHLVAPGGSYQSVKSPTSERDEYMAELSELIGARKLTPVIDRTYPLEQTADAHGYAELGHKGGNVVIEVAPG